MYVLRVLPFGLMLFMFFHGSAVGAQNIPVVLHDELVVSEQGVVSDHATVAINRQGTFFVTWNVQDAGGRYAVKAKIFNQLDPYGSPVIAISDVNDIHNNLVPDVSSDGLYRFVVVWSSQISQSHFQVKAKILSKDGAVLVNTFVVNDTYLNQVPPVPRPNPSAKQNWPSPQSFLYVNFPDVAMNKSGDFVVVWDQWDGAQQNRYIRYYNKKGVPYVQALRLNNFPTTLAYSGLPDVDMNDNGDVVVAWGEDFGGTSAIAYRYFNLADGAIIGDEVLIQPRALASREQVRPMVSINAKGDALISWSEREGASTAVYAAKYDQVSQQWGRTLSPRLYRYQANRMTGVILSSGEVIVGYSPFVMGSKNIVVQRFSSNFGATPPLFVSVLNQYQVGTQMRAAFAMQEGTLFDWLVTVWDSDGVMGQGVHARVAQFSK